MKESLDRNMDWKLKVWEREREKNRNFERLTMSE
jgi:hypothetical protein